jgi:muramidase (phage lysozyme)
MNGKALFQKLSRPARRGTFGEAYITSDSRLTLGRESEGARILRTFALVLSLCLTFGPVTARGGAAKAKAKTSTEVLTEQYSLDESPDESDGALIRRKLSRLLARADVRLFLAVIKKAEGGEPNLMVGGCRATTLKLHPALTLPHRCRFYVPGWGYSTASGNYQITYSNWKELAPFLGLEDFSETSQALVALELIRRGGGAADADTPRGLAMKRRIQEGFLNLLRGNVKSALCLASYDWASSICSPFPASYKIDYAKLAEEVHQSFAAERARTSELHATRAVESRGVGSAPKVATRRSRPDSPGATRRPACRQVK